MDVMQKTEETVALPTCRARPHYALGCSLHRVLRAGEFTVPSPQGYDPDVHLSLSDMAIDSHTDPSTVRLRIKQSKTDPFRQGVEVFLGRTDTAICPVRALVHYIGIRTAAHGPLFVLQLGIPLTLMTQLQAALRKAFFNGHSFRIGAATTAAMQGLEDSDTGQVAFCCL